MQRQQQECQSDKQQIDKQVGNMGNCCDLSCFPQNYFSSSQPQNEIVTEAKEHRQPQVDHPIKISSKDSKVVKQAKQLTEIISNRPLNKAELYYDHDSRSTENQLNSNNPSQEKQNQLTPKHQQFLKSQRLNDALHHSNDLPTLLQIASQAQKLNLFTQSKDIYNRGLLKILNQERHFSKKSIQEANAYIYTQLTNLSIAQKNEAEVDTYFAEAMDCYKMATQHSTIEERITLLNNYSLYKQSCRKLQAAIKHLLEAIALMEKYYTVADERKYLSMVNLVCLYYESSQIQQARNAMKEIRDRCPSREIVKLAEENRRHYQAKK